MSSLCTLPVMDITKNLFMILCSFSVVFAKTAEKLHCQITCEPNLQHTMCIFTEMNPHCEQLKITPSDEIRNDILLWHNDLRSEFLDNVPKSVFPPNTKYRKLCWDEELAEMARRWAVQCEPVNDRCRKLPRFEVGQNVGIQIGVDQPPSSLQILAGWAKPMDPEFSLRNVELPRNRRSMERFFQLISVDTYLVGCAEVTYKRSGLKHRLLVCNYGPAAISDMTKVYAVAVELRKTRLMEGGRWEGEERKRKKLVQGVNLARSALPTSRKFGTPRSRVTIPTNNEGKQFEYAHRRVEQQEPRVGSPLGDGKNYCDIDCNGGRHIMCPSDEAGGSRWETASCSVSWIGSIYNPCAPPIVGVKYAVVTLLERAYIKPDKPSSCDVVHRIDDSFLKGCIINSLNGLRNSVAGGLPPLPSASDMRILIWDQELAWLAGKWATRCSRVPDSCRDVERFHVNQLVMVGVSSEIRDESHCPILMDAVSKLTSMLDDNVIHSYSVSSTDFLRYLTQAIWSRSSRVGCAEVLFRPEPTRGLTSPENVDHREEQFSSLVCNFGEGGNELNQKVFQAGGPCSRCPQGTSCSDSQYPNLCVGETPYSNTPEELLGNRRLEDNQGSGLEDDIVSGSGEMKTPFDYCEITCDGKRHVMCSTAGKPRPCNKMQVMDDSALRKCVVSSLNDLRNRVAEGNYSPLPPASDMRMLIWDRELADLARRWATQCIDGTDECRDVARFSVNQVMLMYVSSETHDKSRCPDLMEMLKKNLPSLHPNITENYQVPDGDPVSYLTQAIWSKSSRVGCSELLFYTGWGLDDDYRTPEYFDDHTPQHSNLVCNFGEGGNEPSRRVYLAGEPCSRCPQGTTCAGRRSPEYAPYPALCVEETPP